MAKKGNFARNYSGVKGAFLQKSVSKETAEAILKKYGDPSNIIPNINNLSNQVSKTIESTEMVCHLSPRKTDDRCGVEALQGGLRGKGGEIYFVRNDGDILLVRNSESRLRVPEKLFKKGKSDTIGDEELPNDIKPYFYKRYVLFSQFDQGIKLDQEGWFSATPEIVAKHTAKRLQYPKILDGFGGVGGNSIQFACAGSKVTTIELDKGRAELIKHNAIVYGIQDNISVLNEDFLLFDSRGQEWDVVFMSPPWGGTGYIQKDYSIFSDITPDIVKSTKKACQLGKRVASMLPRNSMLSELIKLYAEILKEDECKEFTPYIEIERIFMNNKMTCIQVYLGAFRSLDLQFDRHSLLPLLLAQYTFLDSTIERDYERRIITELNKLFLGDLIKLYNYTLSLSTRPSVSTFFEIFCANLKIVIPIEFSSVANNLEFMASELRLYVKFGDNEVVMLPFFIDVSLQKTLDVQIQSSEQVEMEQEIEDNLHNCSDHEENPDSNESSSVETENEDTAQDKITIKRRRSSLHKSLKNEKHRLKKQKMALLEKLKTMKI